MIRIVNTSVPVCINKCVCVYMGTCKGINDLPVTCILLVRIVMSLIKDIVIYNEDTMPLYNEHLDHVLSSCIALAEVVYVVKVVIIVGILCILMPVPQVAD